MNWSMVKSLLFSLAVLSSAMMTSACNTTKATADTMVKFVSSTSPDAMFTQDGMVGQKEKVNLFAGAAYDNLRQEVAQGGGQYVTSLAVLMNIPPSKHEEFAQFLQSRHSTLFTADLFEDHAAHRKFVAAIDRELGAQ